MTHILNSLEDVNLKWQDYPEFCDRCVQRYLSRERYRIKEINIKEWVALLEDIDRTVPSHPDCRCQNAEYNQDIEELLERKYGTKRPK